LLIRGHGLREDESVEGNEPRGVISATQAASQRISQAGFWDGLEIPGFRARGTDGSVVEITVMKTPTIFQWYQILRNHYQFTVFQAVRAALWLVR